MQPVRESYWCAKNAVNGAIDFINGFASVGNAIVNNPGFLVDILGGAGLVVLGAGGELGGFALDSTGAGAVAGIPLNIVSAGAITGGAALVGAGVIGLANEAAGASKAEPLKRDSAGDSRNDGRDTEPRLPVHQQTRARTAAG
jgi:hypothetical protein